MTSLNNYQEQVREAILRRDGAALMNATITPKSASNRLVVRFQTATFINVVNSNAQASWILRDAGTSAVATRVVAAVQVDLLQHLIVYETTAGSTAATTFFVRVGAQSGGGGTVEINGSGGSQKFAGTSFSTLEIFEFTP